MSTYRIVAQVSWSGVKTEDVEDAVQHARTFLTEIITARGEAPNLVVRILRADREEA